MRIWGLLPCFLLCNSIHGQFAVEENDVVLLKKIIYEYFDDSHFDQKTNIENTYNVEEDHFLRETPEIVYERINILYDRRDPDHILYEHYEKLERIVRRTDY